jgi:arylformamidase
MMKTTFKIQDRTYQADLHSGIDLSLAVDANGPKAWYVNPPDISPVLTDRFTGSVALGGAVNFYNVAFNPHGHGTHTECVGHISKEKHSVNKHFKQWFCTALVISIKPEIFYEDHGTWVKTGDRVILANQLKDAIGAVRPEAIIIRTLPNNDEKLHKDYSNQNAPYLIPEAMTLLNELEIKHLLIDLPSVDREEDGGLLRSHHVFWNYPEAPELEKTITELIFVPDSVLDGLYLLNLQVAAIENDASPSRPVIFKAELI